MHIYDLSVSGKMFYFKGDLSETDIAELDTIVKSIPFNPLLKNSYEAFANSFQSAAEQAGIKLTRVEIEHVFRGGYVSEVKI